MHRLFYSYILFTILYLPHYHSRASEPAIILEGTYHYMLRPETPKPIYTSSKHFQIYLSKCKWKIFCFDNPSPFSDGHLYSSNVATLDDDYIYFIQHYNTNIIQKTILASSITVSNDIPAVVSTIYKGSFPPPEVWDIQKIWFAYASSCVLRETNGPFKPPFSTDLSLFYTEASFFVHYYWSTNISPTPQRTLVLMNNGELIYRDAASGIVKHGTYAPPYNKGFTNAVGVWTKPIDRYGLTVYQGFHYSEHAPVLGGRDSSDLITTYSYSCDITNIYIGDYGHNLPSVPDTNVLVVDRRLAEQGWARLVYFATNNWHSIQDAQLIAKNYRKWTYEEEVLDKLGIASDARNVTSKRHVIWLLMALPLMLLVLKGLFNATKSKNHEK